MTLWHNWQFCTILYKLTPFTINITPFLFTINITPFLFIRRQNMQYIIGPRMVSCLFFPLRTKMLFGVDKFVKICNFNLFLF